MDEEYFKFKFDKLNVNKLIEDLYYFINNISLVIYNNFSLDVKEACLIYEIGVEKYDLVDVCITYVFDVNKLKKTITPETLIENIEVRYNCRVELNYLDDEKSQCHIYVYLI